MLYKHLTNRLNKKDEKNYLFSNIISRNRNKYNSLLLSYSNDHNFNSRPSTAKYINKRKNTKKSRINSAYPSFSLTKKPTSPTTVRSNLSPSPSQIYKRLEMSDKIEKIVKEQSKKIFFKKRINYGLHLTVEELRNRFMNPIPQNTYKRNLERKIKEKLKQRSKSFFERSKKDIKKRDNNKILDINNNIDNLIKSNSRLIRNFGSFSFGNELRHSRRNLSIVNDYFEKAAKLNKRLSIIKANKFNEDTENIDIGNILKKQKSWSKMNDKKYEITKKDILKRKKKKLKEKSKVFDNIVIDEINSNLEKIKSIKDSTTNRNKINYAALSNQIFISNLIRQMKIIYIKDPAMNILRGKNLKKISDLRKEVSLYDEFEGLYNNKYNEDITFSRFNKIKLTLPKFIKTKYKKSTNLKYGQINDNYFGIPV